MTTEIDHNKLIKKIVRDRLKSIGVIQKGQTRTFLYDKGWYTIVIEFQPSSWSKGTYLNIGVDFNFFPRDYFVFAYGYRQNEFEEYNDEILFIEKLNELCDMTIKKVQEIDLKFVDIYSALKAVEKESNNDTWRIYEAAILNALTSNLAQSKTQLRKVCNDICENDIEKERNKIAGDILSWLTDDNILYENIVTLIHNTRQLKKLPTINLDNLKERKTTPNSALPKAGLFWLRKLFASK